MSELDTTTKFFDVELTVSGKVPAQNAGMAVEILAEYVRQGLGPDDRTRRHNTRITHAQATAKSVFIPEKGAPRE